MDFGYIFLKWSKMTVCKIGGSVITNKHSSGSPKLDVDMLKAILKDAPEDSLLVFGTGSFGHDKARELGLTEEWSEVECEDFLDELESYYAEVRELAGELCEFGGVAVDGKRAKIISSDLIATQIAHDSGDDLYFYSDIDGVHMQDGTVVSEFGGGEAVRLIENMEQMPVTDMTGGLRGKLEKIRDIGFQNQVRFRNIAGH